MEGRPPQKHLTLIIARELASQLATATFIADAQGRLVFYNEAAEEILGRTFAEAVTARTAPTDAAAARQTRARTIANEDSAVSTDHPY